MGISCRPVHAIRGRVRLRVANRGTLNGLDRNLQTFLQRQSGIDEARLNRRCRSLVVRFDAGIWDAQKLISLVSGFSTAPRPARVSGDCHSAGDPPDEPAGWLPLGLSTAAFAAGLFAKSSMVPWLLLGAAIPIIGRAFDTLIRKRKLNVDVLDAAATGVLMANGQFVTGAAMVWLINLGDVIRDMTMQKSRHAIRGLFDDRMQKAWVLRDGKKYRVNVIDVREGDDVVVYPGECVAIDGSVTAGEAIIDESCLTGESIPVTKGVGDSVFASTVVRDGKICLKAEKVGEDTMVAKIVHLVEEAPVRDTRIQNHAERLADRVVPWSLLGASWRLLAGGNVNAAAGILIADYGTGIRVSAPTTVLSSMTLAARQGVLFKGGGRYLERLAEVDTIVFDKTGTLTQGTPELLTVIPYGTGVTEERVLMLAAAAEQRLTHPIARAIERAARERQLPIPERDASDYTIGLGVEALVEGSVVRVGSHRFMALADLPLGAAGTDMLGIEGRAATPLFVSVDGDVIGLLAFADPLHGEAPDVVSALREGESTGF